MSSPPSVSHICASEYAVPFVFPTCGPILAPRSAFSIPNPFPLLHNHFFYRTVCSSFKSYCSHSCNSAFSQVILFRNPCVVKIGALSFTSTSFTVLGMMGGTHSRSVSSLPFFKPKDFNFLGSMFYFIVKHDYNYYLVLIYLTSPWFIPSFINLLLYPYIPSKASWVSQDKLLLPQKTHCLPMVLITTLKYCWSYLSCILYLFY